MSPKRRPSFSASAAIGARAYPIASAGKRSWQRAMRSSSVNVWPNECNWLSFEIPTRTCPRFSQTWTSRSMTENCFGNSDRVPSTATTHPSMSSAKLIAVCPSINRRYSFTISRGCSSLRSFVNSKRERWSSSCVATNSSYVEPPVLPPERMPVERIPQQAHGNEREPPTRKVQQEGVRAIDRDHVLRRFGAAERPEVRHFFRRQRHVPVVLYEELELPAHIIDVAHASNAPTRWRLMKP